MNCQEFREYLYAGTAARVPTATDHAEGCPECARLGVEMTRLDQDLGAALAVEVPADLAGRIRMRQRLSEGRGRDRAWLGAYALAASLLLAVGVAWELTRAPLPPAPETLVLSHVAAEPAAFQVDYEIAPSELDSFLAPLHTRAVDGLGPVRFAADCAVGTERGLHLVLDGELGPVTVLIIPDLISGRMRAISDERYDGLLIPRPEGGIYAIVGEKGERLQPVAEHLRRNLHAI